MAKKVDYTNLNNLSTDPLMDKTLGAIVGTPSSDPVESKTPVEGTPAKKKKNKTPTSKMKDTIDKTSSTQKTTEVGALTEGNQRNVPEYHKEVVEIEGVGPVEKTISASGNIIGRRNVPTSEKKKPITLTLSPKLYDKVKEKAAADHRTTSEYLAIIIEKHLNE